MSCRRHLSDHVLTLVCSQPEEIVSALTTETRRMSYHVCYRSSAPTQSANLALPILLIALTVPKPAGNSKFVPIPM